MASVILILGTRRRWVINFTPQLLYSQEGTWVYALNRKLGGAQSRSGHFEKDRSTTLNTVTALGCTDRMLQLHVAELANILKFIFVGTAQFLACYPALYHP
jgi:hypothetical protein